MGVIEDGFCTDKSCNEHDPHCEIESECGNHGWLGHSRYPDGIGKCIITCSPVITFPKFAAFAVKFYNPVITLPIIVSGFISVNPGIRISADE